MNQRYRYLLPICAALATIAFPEGTQGQQTKAQQQQAIEFIRLTQDGQHLKALQTSIARYQSSQQDVTVDLIGAVHIGERSYFETLNEVFKDYDVVLYELVAPEGTRIPRGGRTGGAGNPISFMQTSAQKFLGLESQLKLVDYTPDNFRHADMSPDELREKMAERGQSPLSLALGAFTEMMNDPDMAAKLGDQGGASLSDLLDMIGNPLKAKRFMAKQMGAMGSLDSGLGSSLNQLIVVDRNKAAMKVLDETIQQGHKKIGIFYGAAHMPDFHERLLEREFKFVRDSWLTAWDLTQSHAVEKQDPATSLLMQLMKELNK